MPEILSERKQGSVPGIANWVPAQCCILFVDEQKAMVLWMEEMEYKAQRDGHQRAACRPNGASGETFILCGCVFKLVTNI